MVHGRKLWGSAAGTGSGRSDKVNYPPGDRGRTGIAEKEDVDGDEGWFVKRRGVSSRRAGCPFCLEEKSELEL